MVWLKNILRKEPEAPAPSPIPLAKAAPRPPVNPPADDAPAAAWVAAILDCDDRTLALSWADRLSDDPSLAEIAAGGRYAELRLAAVDRIVGSSALERVAEASRNRDKGVFRRCQERLRQRRTAGDTAQRAGELAAELRSLLDSEPLPLTRLVDLEQALIELPGADADPTVAACRPLLADAHARLQREAEQRRAVSLGEADAAALRNEIAACDAEWPADERIDDWRCRQQALAALADGMPRWLAGEAAAARLCESLAILAAAIDTLTEDQRRLQAAETALSGTAAGAPADPEAIRALWNGLDKPRHGGALQRLTRHYEALLPAPVAKPKPAAKAAEKRQSGGDREAQRALIDRLEQAIAEGHLADAETIENELAGQSLGGELAARHQRVRGQLSQLEGWARWGTDQARDHLISAAETLLAAKLPVDELAKQIPALRAAWKETNGPIHSRKAQWERFDAALTAAYQPVLEARAVEDQRRSAVRAAKEALLGEWRAQLENPDWSAATHGERAAWRRTMLSRWHAAGHADHRHERALKKGFDALIAEIDRQANAALQAEADRRSELVTRAEQHADALAGGAELGATIEAIKELQKAWKLDSAPLLPRKDEQRLWRAFRAACDRVFNQRDEDRARQNAERDARNEARKSRLDAFASELDTLADGGDPNALRQALRRFQNEVGNTRHDRRAEALEKRAQEMAAALSTQRERGRYTLLLRKAELAATVEAAACAGTLDEAALAAARSDWEALAALPPALEAPLAARFAQAPQADQTMLTAGRSIRDERLLDLEIALELPTPKAFGAQRQQRQLQRLQAHFAEGERATHADPATALSACLGIAAPADEQARQRITAVAEHAAGRGNRPAGNRPAGRRPG